MLSKKSLTYYVHVPLIFFSTLMACAFFHKVFGVIIIQDDLNEILYSPYVNDGTNWWQLFGLVKFHYYAPLKHLANFVITNVSNTTADIIFTSLLFNIFLHITNAVLLYFITLKLSKNSLLAFLTALTFGADIIHYQVFAGMAARGHLYSGLFALILCLLYMWSSAKKLNIIIPIVYALALLFWATVMFIPLTALFYYTVILKRKITKSLFLKNILPLVVITFCYGCISFLLNKLFIFESRWYALEHLARPFYDVWGWQAVYKVPVRFLQWFVLATPLRAIDMKAILFTSSAWKGVAIYGGIFAALAFAVKVLYKKQKEVLAVFAFFVASLMPFILYVYTSESTSVRHVYVASMATTFLFCFAVIKIFEHLNNKALFYFFAGLVAINIYYPVIDIFFFNR